MGRSLVEDSPRGQYSPYLEELKAVTTLEGKVAVITGGTSGILLQCPVITRETKQQLQTAPHNYRLVNWRGVPPTLWPCGNVPHWDDEMSRRHGSVSTAGEPYPQPRNSQCLPEGEVEATGAGQLVVAFG
jgi:hypothetical protein